MVRSCSAALSLVLILTLGLAAGAQDIVTTTAGTKLLAAPQLDAPVVAILGDGDRLTVTDTRSGWRQVQTWIRSDRGFIDRKTGWIETDRLRPVGSVEILVAPGPWRQSEPDPAAARHGRKPAQVIATVSGTPALKFLGDCLIVGEDGRTRRRTFRGTVPRRYTFDGRALSCRFEKQDFRGRLRADLYVDVELPVRVLTLAPFNWIRVRTDGPWGKAAGTEGHRRVLVRRDKRFDRKLRGPVPIVPPLSGTMIPPLVSD